MKPRASLAKVRLIVAAGVLMAACGRSTPQASEPKALDLAAGTRVGAQGTRVAARGTDWFNEGLNGAGSNVNAAHAQFPVPADHAAIVVAVIDSGIDIFHEDLAAHIWKNPREIPANRVDDDQNGYVDDVNGWNFLVDKNGRDIAGETLELTREFARYYKPYLASQNGTGPALSSSDHNRLVSLYNEFAPKFRAAAPGSDEAQYHYNYKLEQRGDDLTDFLNRRYGNASVVGSDPLHGTHVAGIIAAVRGNGRGIDGIATNVRIMVLRAVPNGDEQDKDVAAAVRYAADNGARVVNMSFGKSLSRFPAKVLEAMDYAAGKGVLFVHAAGNDAKNTDVAPNFPTRNGATSRLAASWIEVGAATDRPGADLPATFSNYGQTAVDLFAPGFQIRSTTPGNTYTPLDGTSMASPVVAGVAALIFSHKPALTAVEVKTLILATAKRFGSLSVRRPGTATRVSFGALSRTGSVVDAQAALTLLYQR